MAPTVSKSTSLTTACKQVLFSYSLSLQKWSWLNKHTHTGDAAIKQPTPSSLLPLKKIQLTFYFLFLPPLQKFNKQLPPSLIMFSRNWSWITTTTTKFAEFRFSLAHQVQKIDGLSFLSLCGVIRPSFPSIIFVCLALNFWTHAARYLHPIKFCLCSLLSFEQFA